MNRDYYTAIVLFVLAILEAILPSAYPAGTLFFMAAVFLVFAIAGDREDRKK